MNWRKSDLHRSSLIIPRSLARKGFFMARMHLALSLKQPWATLLAHGRKTIEVRRWPTKQRGRILIHAARIPDPRPEAWAFVSKELWPVAQQVGGIIGVGELTECLSYRSLEN